MTEPGGEVQCFPLRPPGPVLGTLIFFHSLTLSAETVSVPFPLCLHFISDVSREAANFTPKCSLLYNASKTQELFVLPAG